MSPRIVPPPRTSGRRIAHAPSPCARATNALDRARDRRSRRYGCRACASPARGTSRRTCRRRSARREGDGIRRRAPAAFDGGSSTRSVSVSAAPARGRAERTRWRAPCRSARSTRPCPAPAGYCSATMKLSTAGGRQPKRSSRPCCSWSRPSTGASSAAIAMPVSGHTRPPMTPRRQLDHGTSERRTPSEISISGIIASPISLNALHQPVRQRRMKRARKRSRANVDHTIGLRSRLPNRA